MKDPPAGFSSFPLTLSGTQTMTRLAVKTTLTESPQPVSLAIEGRAKIGQREVAHEAVPAEDRMQAFLWRHLVPAQDLKALVFAVRRNRHLLACGRRLHRLRRAQAGARRRRGRGAPAKAKFTKQQVAGRLRQLKLLFEEGLLTEGFYDRKVAELETGL